LPTVPPGREVVVIESGGVVAEAGEEVGRSVATVRPANTPVPSVMAVSP
jgi:hypothetical protein